jgi:16S rRNA (guanine527-N7)-methyltransferase
VSGSILELSDDERAPFLLSVEQWESAERFRRLLETENKVQNLTRLTGPKQFLEGHLRDVTELQRSGAIAFPAADLGSGCGVPGLLFAILYGGKWVLVDSERRKCEFLERMVSEFGLSDTVQVKWGRIEQIFLTGGGLGVVTIVSRALATVEKTLGWVRGCSTWNTAVFLKGPRWQSELMDAAGTLNKLRLVTRGNHDYSVGVEGKLRTILWLSRE